MIILLTTLHVIVCVILVVVVLLQHGKGADMGAILGGGGGNTVFGARGAGNFLSKLTTGCAVVFMLTSLSLSYLATESSDTQLFDASFEAPADETPSGAVPEEVQEELEEISPGELEEIESGALVPIEPDAAGSPAPQ